MQDVDFSVKKVNLYEEIADRLEQMIISNADNVGEKLPAEQSIANKFGVSRNVVREAFKLLKERGLITLRTGDGAYISMPEENMFTEMLSRYLAMQKIDADATYEMRRLLEGYAVRCAANRASEEDIEELTLLNEQMQSRGGDVERRISLDISFHKTIADMSGNPLLSMFVGSMADLKRNTISQAICTDEGHESGVHYHDAIIRAITVRDEALAERLMRDHLKESHRQYMQILEESGL